MSNVHDLVRAANPVAECPAPPIEKLWARLERGAEVGVREVVGDGSSVESGPGDRHAVGKTLGPPRARVWLGRLLIGLAGAAAIAIGVAAVVVLHRDTNASNAPAAGSIPSPDRGLSGILGVLRRPQTKADLDPALLRRLETRSALPFQRLMGTPVRDLIRLATITPWGDKVFLVPYRPPSRRVIEASLARLKVPAAREREEVRRLAGRGYVLGLFVLGQGGGCCSSAAAIEAGNAALESGPSPNTVVLVVPDTVAKVTVRLRDPVSATVHNNVAAFVVQQPVENLSVDKMIWYGRTGAIVKRFAPPIKTHRRAPQALTTNGVGPAPVSAGEVAAPLALRALPAGLYCDAPEMRLVLCSAGQRPVISQPMRLLELSFIARRATGLHSWYAWNLAAPDACRHASTGGTTHGTVQTGTRLVFDDLIPPDCRGTATVLTTFVTQAPTTDKERSALVGRRTLLVR